MKVLKGIAIGVLTFLLFWSLSGLGIALMLNLTVLNPDFVLDEMDKADVYTIAKDELIRQIPNNPQISQYMTPAIEATMVQIEPWVKEQTRDALYASYDYLKGKTSTLRIQISTDQVQSALKDNLWKEFQKSPPPELAMLPPDQAKQLFDQTYSQIAASIPPNIELTEGMLSPENRATLQRVRSYVSYFDTVFWALIAFTVLLIAGVVLITRNVRTSTRGLGVTFVTYGALELIGVFAARYFASNYLSGQQIGMDIPASLQAFLPQLLSDVLAPLQFFAIGILAAGVALIIVSHVYKPREMPSQS